MHKKKLKGKMIEPLDLEANKSVKDFIDNVFGGSSYNARKLSEAGKIFLKMLDNDATVCLTFAGAMTPIGMAGPVIQLMEKGFIDLIISTGANIYHDLHRAFNFPMFQGDEHISDKELHKEGISRIYDVFIEDSETMLPTDEVIINTAYELKNNEPISTAQFHNVLGKNVLKVAPHPEKSFLAMAAKFDVPIYTSSPGDSSVAMNLARPYIFNHKLMIDPLLDIIETTSIVKAGKKNGVIIVGGGSPKNFYLQTQPTLWQIFFDSAKGGHDYFIQLTTDSPHWGGLSGATPQEAESWGKVKNPEKNSMVVYSCASLTFPLLAQYALQSHEAKKRKEIYAKIDEFKKEFIKAEMKNELLIKVIKETTDPENYRKIYEKFLGRQNS